MAQKYKTKPIRQDLTCYKGQTYSQNIRFLEDDGTTPISLEGITAKAKVRPSPNSTVLITELVCTVYPDEGKVNLAMDADVSALLPDGIFDWDLKMTDTTDHVAYYLQGKFYVKGRVTD